MAWRRAKCVAAVSTAETSRSHAPTLPAVTRGVEKVVGGDKDARLLGAYVHEQRRRPDGRSPLRLIEIHDDLGAEEVEVGNRRTGREVGMYERSEPDVLKDVGVREGLVRREAPRRRERVNLGLQLRRATNRLGERCREDDEVARREGKRPHCFAAAVGTSLRRPRRVATELAHGVGAVPGPSKAAAVPLLRKPRVPRERPNIRLRCGSRGCT